MGSSFRFTNLKVVVLALNIFNRQNLSGHNAIVNCLAANADGVMVSGADNGTMYFWDWKTGYNFQRFQVHISLRCGRKPLVLSLS